MEYAYLLVHLDDSKGTFVGGHDYYYKLPIYDANGYVVTNERAKEAFLLDGDRHLHLLDALPTDGCSNYVELGDLRIPIPNPHQSTVSVLRVDHIVRAGENFEIVGELKDWGVSDKAYVEILGLSSLTGRYPMSAVNQQVPIGSNTYYSWRRQFPVLPAGISIEYRVYANDQSTYLSGIIHVDNTNPVHGPVWGDWMPKIVQIGADYSDQVPLDAATGTGTVVYSLISAPTWYKYTQNTRNVVSSAPGTIPTVAETVTYRASDNNGSTDKTFTLQYSAELDMVAGWGFENVPGGSKLSFGIGPNDDTPPTVKIKQLVGSGFSDTSTHTAQHVGISLVSASYPWSCIYDNVPIGTYQAEITRANGQKRYATFVFTGQQGGWPLTLLTSPPTSPTNPATDPAIIDGDDILANTGTNDGSLNDNVEATTPTLLTLDADGPIVLSEGASIQLRCLAGYSNGTSVNVVAQANGSVTSGGGVSLSAGLLSALTNSTLGDTHYVTVQFSFGGKTAEHQVQVIDTTAVPVTLKSIAWRFPGATSGPYSVVKGSDTQLSVIATYSDNSTADITATAAKGGGITGADILQNGLFRVASTFDNGSSVTLSATYNGKVDFITIGIKAATQTMKIELVDVAVKEDKLIHYVRTSPVSHQQFTAPVQQIYYRMKTNVSGGSLPLAYGAWSSLNRLFDHTDSGLGSLQNSNLLSLNFNHLMYGSWLGANYPQYTVWMQLALTADGAGAIECVYTVPAFAAQPTVTPIQIYPNVN